MKLSVHRTVMALLVCATLAAPVLADDAAQPTVGDFLHRVATARLFPAVDGPDAERLLRASGVGLPALNLADGLTEGTVVAISGALGLRVSTSRPDAPFREDSVSLFLDLMVTEAPSPEHSASTGEPGPYPRPNDRAADPRTKGRGKKKGLPPVSESSPV